MNVMINNVVIKSTIYDLHNEKSKVSDEENKKEIFNKGLEQLKKTLEGNDFKTEEEQDRYQKKLNEKIRVGSKLSPSEMSYIQRTNPMMYMHIKRVQMQREMLENQLKQCKSKKEVQETYNQSIAMICDKDPDKQLLVSAYNNVTEEFKKTRQYQALPRDIKYEKGEKISIKKEITIDISV